ncbi:hypothetical protein HAP99_10060 [Acidithiobacillus caldus]|uniref:hypothetical protein n=1 Tax=Acidithiobacillus caldus TaxID=33059 RepID=UPI001C076BC5|nr:hypothetical protein [Acidithiobacillus caldus]MBU2783513.1 hypothetical protein [Acidithiobacillus caldus]
MSNKQTDENPPRGPKGEFLPGVRYGGGRPKGSRNAASFTMKEALTEAFWQAGGIGWLVNLAHSEPKVFASLLLRLLPPTPAESEEQDMRPYIDPDDEEPLQ